ncbi:hypothetical protein JW758_05530 [Candidatus Peregrinibacteria bacterium]|nr:hypothetical protein [Candidatus Peregrinibacteria bacterium]
MYTKGILERYGEAIIIPELKNLFLSKIELIQFTRYNTIQACTAGAVAQVLRGTDAEGLVDDLSRNFMQFVEAEDIEFEQTPIDTNSSDVEKPVPLTRDTVRVGMKVISTDGLSKGEITGVESAGFLIKLENTTTPIGFAWDIVQNFVEYIEN